MSEFGRSEITAYLVQWGRGEPAAFAALAPLVERELRRLARRSLRGERPDHTLQTTALVNEAWIRLANERDIQWHNRAHFFGVAAQLMRFILVDYARRHNAAKRGGGMRRVSLSEALGIPDERYAGLLELDAALSRLERIDERKARVATLRLFAGASLEETALTLGVSTITVTRDRRFARAWLERELRGAERPASPRR